jgi:Family of unknown function (DUF5990)
MRVRIEGVDLPGRSCAPDPAGRGYDNVHVGIQRRGDVVDLIPADAAAATWAFEVTTRVVDGAIDVGGPFVHGARGARFVYLSWGTVAETGGFTMFRRAKIHINDVDADVLATAARGGCTLVGRLRLTDARGHPICARVRPADITWRLSPSHPPS